MMIDGWINAYDLLMHPPQHPRQIHALLALMNLILMQREEKRELASHT